MNDSKSNIYSGQVFFVLLISIWAGLALATAKMNWFQFLPTGFAGMVALGGILFLLCIYKFWTPFNTFVNAIPMKHLTLFHLWRLAAGLIFIDAFTNNLLPWIFARNAGWGDIIVGLLVPIVFLFKEKRRKYIIFHIFSFADFMLAVGTGLYLRFITTDMLMANINEYPMALMPLFGVPVTGALSIIALYRLKMNINVPE